MKIGFFTAMAATLGLVALSGQPTVAQNAKASMTLKVNVMYTGSGTVDDKHKVYVVLWDSLDFVKGGGAPPVEILPTASKDGSVTFDNVKTVPAYVSAVFDPKGEWDAQSGPPPEGSSLGLYMKTPGTPEPIHIEAGKTATITVTFDDSIKMQAGRAER